MNSTVLSLFDTPNADPVAQLMPLLSSPWPISFIALSYLLFVLKFGRMFMKDRKPYNVKGLMLAYNVFQVIYNAVMFIYGFYYMFIEPAYNFNCMETLPLDHPKKNTERWLTYSYFINKILDLLDTVFFVLRKSYKQITFLHVYHHILMFVGLYWVIRLYGVGGQYCVTGFCNSFVHTVMYAYYFISAMNPGLKGSLWWKKYITRIQLVQFIILLIQPLLVLAFNPGCQFPMAMQYMQIAQAVAMIVMFGNFYIKAYIKPQHQKQQ